MFCVLTDLLVRFGLSIVCFKDIVIKPTLCHHLHVTKQEGMFSFGQICFEHVASLEGEKGENIQTVILAVFFLC